MPVPIPKFSTSDLIDAGVSRWRAHSNASIYEFEQSVLFCHGGPLTESQRETSMAKAASEGYNHLGRGKLCIDVLFKTGPGASWATGTHDLGGIDVHGHLHKSSAGRAWTVRNLAGTCSMSGKTTEGAVLQYKIDLLGMADREMRIKLEAAPESSSGFAPTGPRVLYIGNLQKSTATQADKIDPTSKTPFTVTFAFECDMYDRGQPSTSGSTSLPTAGSPSAYTAFLDGLEAKVQDDTFYDPKSFES